MMENHALFLSVFMCVGGVIVASWEMVPQLNELIQLAPFPDDIYRYKVPSYLLCSPHCYPFYLNYIQFRRLMKIEL